MNVQVFEDLQRIQQEREADRLRMEGLGVTEESIALLVNTFYGRIRESPSLGPIFNGAISDWPKHLATMNTFWSSLILRSNTYTGKPIQAHMKLDGLTSEHYRQWLILFDLTLRDVFPEAEAREPFITRARAIAERLESVTVHGNE